MAISLWFLRGNEVKILILKILHSIKLSNKFFIDAQIDDLFILRGISVLIKKAGPVVTMPMIFKENRQPFTSFIFATKELAVEFRTAIREEFLKHAANGTLRPDTGAQDQQLATMAKPLKQRNGFSKKRVSFKRGRKEKKNYPPKAETIGNVPEINTPERVDKG